VIYVHVHFHLCCFPHSYNLCCLDDFLAHGTYNFVYPAGLRVVYNVPPNAAASNPKTNQVQSHAHTHTMTRGRSIFGSQRNCLNCFRFRVLVLCSLQWNSYLLVRLSTPTFKGSAVWPMKSTPTTAKSGVLGILDVRITQTQTFTHK
jgi:hypothetical protein